MLIVGGGVAGVSCALILGSAYKKAFVNTKQIGIFMHQKASMLQEAVFNNAYGIAPGTLGSTLLASSVQQLAQYPDVIQFASEKVMAIHQLEEGFEVVTTKDTYFSAIVVVAVNSSETLFIKGLEKFVVPHGKTIPEKKRIQLKNVDHLVTRGLYVAGTLAGHRSQLAIAAGSGAAVATDILTLWNDGVHSHSHDSLRKK